MRTYIHIEDNETAHFNNCQLSFYRFEKDLQIEIIDSLFRVRESKIVRSRERSRDVENRRQEMKLMNVNTDTKVKKIIVTARQQAFENSTLRQSSQFERVQMKTIMSNKMMNSKTTFAVHRVDSASGRRRDRERRRERERSRDRERRDREREQAVLEEA